MLSLCDYSPRLIASLGQTLAQVPHSVQASGLIEYFSPSEIAPTGHSSIHVPQAIQSSLITYAIIFNFILLIILFSIHHSRFSMHHSSFAQRHSQFSARYGMFPQRHRLLAMHHNSIPLLHRRFSARYGSFLSAAGCSLCTIEYLLMLVAKLQLNSDIPTNSDKIFIVFPVFFILTPPFTPCSPPQDL